MDPHSLSDEDLEITSYVHYRDTGEIFGEGRTQRVVVNAWIGEGRAIVIGEADRKTHFVHPATGQLCEKQPSSARLEGLRITGLVSPSVITIEGIPYDIDDTFVDLEFDHIGTYNVLVETPSQLAQNLTVVHG